MISSIDAKVALPSVRFGASLTNLALRAQYHMRRNLALVDTGLAFTCLRSTHSLPTHGKYATGLGSRSYAGTGAGRRRSADIGATNRPVISPMR
ncbi:hypothetical protein GCM10023322_71780 [Rugosimonospora acidiphila]|uniref:Uncharacterized protein n=1 Tax=Rugosimonospora acidiphila TaxID=556531 RepID=A0ABP9SNU0_9ACTN